MIENREKELQEAFRQLAAQSAAPSPSFTAPPVSDVSQRGGFKDRLLKAYCSGSLICLVLTMIWGTYVELTMQANTGVSAWPSSLLLLLFLGVPVTTASTWILLGPFMPGPRYYISVVSWTTIGMFIIALVTGFTIVLYRILLIFSPQELTDPFILIWLLDEVLHLGLSPLLLPALVALAPFLGLLFLFLTPEKPFRKAPWLGCSRPARAFTAAGWLAVVTAVLWLTWLNSSYRAVWEDSSVREILSRPDAQRGKELDRNPSTLESVQPSNGPSRALHEALLNSRTSGEDLLHLLEVTRETLDSPEPLDPRLRFIIAGKLDELLLDDHRRDRSRSELYPHAVPVVLELWADMTEAEGADRLWALSHIGTLFALENLLENSALSKDELLEFERHLERLIPSEQDRNTYITVYALQSWNAWELFRDWEPKPQLGPFDRTLILYYRARLFEDLMQLDVAVPQGSKDVLASQGASVFGSSLKKLKWRPFRPRLTERELFSPSRVSEILELPSRLENALLGTKLRLYKEETGSYPSDLSQLSLTDPLLAQIPAQVEYSPEGSIKRREDSYLSTDAPDSLHLPW